MSPEQASGSIDLDARADIYAMGVVLYEMISGHVPFDSDSLADILTSVIHSPPTPLRELVPEVPEKLAFVVETAMAKDREHRFIDARAMRASLIDSGVYVGAEPSSGLMTRLSVDDAEAGVAPTMPSRAAITGPNAVLRPDPSGGVPRRRDPSTKRNHTHDEQVGVFAVTKDDDANKSTPIATESPAPRRPPSSAGGWVIGLLVFGVLAGGIGIAGSSGMFAGGTTAAASEAGMSDGGLAPVDTAPEPVDAGTDAYEAPPVEQDAAVEPAARPPTKRTPGRHPTKRTTRRRTTRRRR
jgi:serine/threonine-protein kinase